MSKRDFKNKVVVITGVSGNLGTELCLAFGQAGAKIAGLDLGKDALDLLEELLDAKGIESMLLSCDITDFEVCRENIVKVMERFYRIDLLINNAGITHIEPYREEKNAVDITRHVMEVNFFGAVNCTETVLEEIISNQGMIINISSVAGFAPLVGRTAYAASKHALHGFFESLRAELIDNGVKVMMVCPSFIGTSHYVFHDHEEQETSAIHQAKKTLGQIIPPDKIAQQILKAATRERELLVLGRTGRLSYFVYRFFPRWYESLMAKKFKEF